MPRRSRRSRSNWRRDCPNWSTAIPGKSSKRGGRCRRTEGVLRGPRRVETSGRRVFRRLAAAQPLPAAGVSRKALRQRNFTWAEQGEALLRQRKPWYSERETRPGIAVIGARLSELIG